MRRASPQAGLSALELVLLVAFLGVMGAVAWPRWQVLQRDYNEAYAIGSMRAIMSAQGDYHAVNAGFAADLAALGKACPGTPVTWLSPELAANGAELAGYLFTATPSGGAVQGVRDCNGTSTYNGYYVSARPVDGGETGDRGFAGSSAGELWQSPDGVPPPEPLEKSGTISVVPR